MGKGRGTVRFASRAVVPRCRVTVLDHWMLQHAERYQQSTVVVTRNKWAEPVLAWLVASKDCRRGGERGGGFDVCRFVEVAG